MLTDIVLSAEIVAVALGAVADEPFVTKAITLSIVSLGMTVAIYGLVAGLVKLDDIGLWLKNRKSDFSSTIGQWIIVGTPILMRVVSVGGTIAMFMVGGGILMHGFHAEEPLHHFIAERLTTNGFLTSTLETLAGALLGVVAGAVAVGIVEGIKWIVHRVRGTTPAAH
jgi:predicted DNA repair protein MutK